MIIINYSWFFFFFYILTKIDDFNARGEGKNDVLIIMEHDCFYTLYMFYHNFFPLSINLAFTI